MSNIPEIPSLLDLLKAGVHFGHKVSRRHPKMIPYIFGARGGINLINLELTQTKLREGLEFVFNLGKENKVLLFIGTKKQAQSIVQKYAVECGQPYVNKKWLGGTFTNFSEIRKLIRKYLDLKDKKVRGEFVKYTKKEQTKFNKEIGKMEEGIGGFSSLTRLPDAVFIVDVKYEKTALVEAKGRKLPVVAICDTNVDPSPVDYPIPSNDDAGKAIELLVGLVAQAYKNGKSEATAIASEAPKEIKEK
ncbi:MAG: 30S ribosomal protein S2 [bacterium]|nr:30S ribosomal protein S2 [bacterium]